MMNLAIGLASLTGFGIILGTLGLLIARRERAAAGRMEDESQLSLFTKEGSEVKVSGDLVLVRRTNRS
jgi:hypothetical protein